MTNLSSAGNNGLPMQANNPQFVFNNLYIKTSQANSNGPVSCTDRTLFPMSSNQFALLTQQNLISPQSNAMHFTPNHANQVQQNQYTMQDLLSLYMNICENNPHNGQKASDISTLPNRQAFSNTANLPALNGGMKSSSTASMEMEALLSHLKTNINELKFTVEYSEAKQKEYCNTIRKKIQQNTSQLINELKTTCASMIAQVDNYESNLLFYSNENQRTNIKEIFDDTNKILGSWGKDFADYRHDEKYIKKRLSTLKELEGTLASKSFLIRNFFALKEQIAFDDTSIKLKQSNVELKSLIGNLHFKPALITENDVNNNVTETQVAPIEIENCKTIQYSKVMENLKVFKDSLVCMFRNKETEEDEFVIGINQQCEGKAKTQRYKFNLKLFNEQQVKLVDSINFNSLIIHMYTYNGILILLTYENEVFSLSLYDNKLKLLKNKLQLDFKPSYINVCQSGVFLFIKESTNSDTLLRMYDWNLNEVVMQEVNESLKKNRIFLKTITDLYIINEKLYLVDKYNAMISIIMCKTGQVVRSFYYTSQHTNHIKQQLAQPQVLPKQIEINKFLVLINSFENVIVVDSSEKVLYIIDSKSVNQSIVYKRSLGFIKNISALQLVDDYVYMVHDRVENAIHTIKVMN